MKSLQKTRKRLELTQQEIAKKLFLSQRTISSWEKGTRTPPVEQLPKLAQVLNCSIEELVYAIIETKNQKEKNPDVKTI